MTRDYRVIGQIVLFLCLTGCRDRSAQEHSESHYVENSSSADASASKSNTLALEALDHSNAPIERNLKNGSIARQRELPTQPAATIDQAYASKDRIHARRLMYRVTLRNATTAGKLSAQSAAELYMDVDSRRLRARFMGAGWPFSPEAEVRMRSDLAGAYLFDSGRGRPLVQGQLARWFEGGPIHSLPTVSVRFAPIPLSIEAGMMVCRFIAELAGLPSLENMRRCEERGPPTVFRLGPWWAERTADVPVVLSKESLRADDLMPPSAAPLQTSGSFLESNHAGNAKGQATQLQVRNETSTRVIVLLSGSPIGWIAPYASASFDGIRAGTYRLGGVRPFGSVALWPRAVSVPGELSFKEARRDIKVE